MFYVSYPFNILPKLLVCQNRNLGDMSNSFMFCGCWEKTQLDLFNFSSTANAKGFFFF